MIIAGLQAGPSTMQPAQQKVEEPPFFTPPFLQPPGQEADKDKQQKAAEAAAAVLSKKNIQSEPADKAASSKDKSRPVSSTPVPGTPWCVVWTGDSRSFFFNPSNKQSVWEKPAELVGRSDVAKMLESPAAAEEFKKRQQAKVRLILKTKVSFQFCHNCSNCPFSSLNLNQRSRRLSSRRSQRLRSSVTRK